MTLFSEDIEVLKELYLSDNAVDMYFFYEKYKLSPAQLGRTLRRFLEIGCIDVVDNNIHLTNTGKEWVIANRKVLFLSSTRKYWKEKQEDMLQEPLNIGELYVPKRCKIDKEIYKLTEDRD